MAVKRNYFFECLLESTVHHLTGRRVREHDCLPHSVGNCLLEDLYSHKATQNPDWRPSNPRREFKMATYLTFWSFESQLLEHFMYILCSWFVICLPIFSLFLQMARLLSPISFYEALLYYSTLFFLNSSVNPVIYCWKMGAIRRTLIDIMRDIVNRFRE